jgi:hypothetical protein
MRLMFSQLSWRNDQQFLKYAQKSNLGVRWKVTDSVKEKSPSVGGFKSSCTSL